MELVIYHINMIMTFRDLFNSYVTCKSSLDF